MRLLAYSVLLVFLALPSAEAIVDPVPADIDEQDWMANILIKGSRSPTYSLLCKGSLIDPYWVLSSTDCLSDPLDIIEDFVAADSADFAVALGNLGGFFRVEERITSPDGNAMLFRLARPADNEPIKLLYRTAPQLRGVNVRLYNNESSASLADEFYNPSGELAVACQIEGMEFFNDGRMCYVTSTLDYSIFPIMARGLVVDPTTADAPNDALSATATLDTSGTRLYVNFDEDRSFPCHEDIGAPLVATLAGEPVQVGMLVAAGMPTEVPLCNGSLLNHLISLEHLREFIEESIAKARFAQSCPAKAEINFEQLEGSAVRFHWDAIDGASGYQILATDALGYEPIQVFDLGASLETTVELEIGLTYTLSLQGYNDQCTGPMSTPLTIGFDS